MSAPVEKREWSKTKTDTEKHIWGWPTPLLYLKSSHSNASCSKLKLSLSIVMYCGSKPFCWVSFPAPTIPVFQQPQICPVRIGLRHLLNNVPFVLCFPVFLSQKPYHKANHRTACERLQEPNLGCFVYVLLNISTSKVCLPLLGSTRVKSASLFKHWLQ